MKIEDEIEGLGPLKHPAFTIVEFVRAGASGKGQFQLTSGEWTWRLDNWINIRFVRQRKKAIHVSLGVYDR
jgi:hypothetical protein